MRGPNERAPKGPAHLVLYLSGILGLRRYSSIKGTYRQKVEKGHSGSRVQLTLAS